MCGIVVKFENKIVHCVGYMSMYIEISVLCRTYVYVYCDQCVLVCTHVYALCVSLLCCAVLYAPAFTAKYHRWRQSGVPATQFQRFALAKSHYYGYNLDPHAYDMSAHLYVATFIAFISCTDKTGAAFCARNTTPISQTSTTGREKVQITFP